MVSFLRYLVGLSSIYSFSDQDIALFNRLIEQSYEKFKILTCRNAVGRIESPQGTGIGTGLLVSNNLFLTCHHIFTKAQLKQAWVRFGYMAGGSMMKDVFELELGPISHSRQLDYALTQLKGFPRIQPVIPVPSQLNSGEKIRAIHYPFGGECVISKPGTVLQVGEGYIDHTVWTENGSSGAPLFDKNWDVIAIHQGQPGISRKVTQKALGGIPIRVVWEHIKGHINK
ncbi:MAG: serine protease [Bacteroidota bacterium]